MKTFTSFLVMFIFTTTVFSQTIYFEDNFDDGISSENWDVFEIGGTNLYDLAFDYVAAGVPAAPNGGGLGFKMAVNTTEVGEYSQILGFPMGVSVKENYILKFDIWMNYTPDGSGTTEFGIFGVKKTNENIPADSGPEFGFACDNGSSDDIRFWLDGTEIKFEDDSTMWAGPMQNGNDDVGPVFPYSESYTGDTPGNQWLTVEIKVTSDSIFFDVNGTTWMHIANTQPEGNVMIGLLDLWGSVADDAQFTIYDNVSVTELTNKVVDFSTIDAKIYPNPTSDVINIEIDDNARFELINSFGQVVHASDVSGNSRVDISQFSSGWYFARLITSDGKVGVQKILKH